MPQRKSSNKNTGLSIALSPDDRKLIDKAAAIVHLPPSTWARAKLIEHAQEIVSEAKAAK